MALAFDRPDVDAGLPPSFWAAAAPPGPALPVFEGDARTDVAIIGAGFTGLSTALHLRAAGVDCTVLEIAEIGWGASGRNNGQVIPNLSRADPAAIVKAYGAAGERLVALLRDSADILFDLVRAHAIDCDAEQTGWIQPAHRPDRLKVSERRVAQWSKAGATVALLDRAQVAALTGSDSYHGGFSMPSGGHINPLALTRGLARAAAAAGANIFVRSPATALNEDGDGWRIDTPRGSLRARALVLATNAYTTGILPDVAHTLVPVRSWQVATQPLGDNVRKSVIPGRQAVSDTRGDLGFFRWAAGGRLVTGRALWHTVGAPEQLARLVNERLAQTFPQIGPVRLDYIWNGFVGMTPDMLPHLYRLGRTGFAWTGCNGRGVSLAVALGRELAAAARGVDPETLALPFTAIKPLPFHALATRLAPLALLQKRRQDARAL
ncbi:MAG: FAD-binding oxidoreductase [Alphaproteobacteria bacterium]|nr:FAD-binding oxidoreductase [Alphaproteobacteria bacterium]